MPDLRIPTVLLALLAFAAQMQARRGEQAPDARSGRWAHEGSQLAPDPAVTWGRLDNGVRYALLPHRGVPGRVAMRFVVLAGSIDERDDEAGIAHFIEHMAFRGTGSFGADEMVSLFQRLGVEYGSDVNAVTTHHYTAYMLDYRENTPELLREGLRFFRGIAAGPTFDPDIIKAESRVILAEMRSRDSLAERQMQSAFPVVFRGLGFARHSPIGTEKSIRSFTHRQFVEFHTRLYRPDLMVITVVGDFDPETMKEDLREGFGDLPPTRSALPARDEGKLNARGLRAGIFRINGVGSAETVAASVIAPDNRPDSREAQVERQKRAFVQELLQERLRSRVPGVGGAHAEYQILMGHEAAIAGVTVSGEDWEHGVLAVDEIIRNTSRNGFDANEIETLRSRRLRMARHLVNLAPTVDPQVLSEALTESITGNTVFVGLGMEQRWQVDWLERFTRDDALKTFRALWNVENMAFHIGGEIDIEVRSSDILKKVQQHRGTGLAYLQPSLAGRALPVLRPKGKPGEVVERREVPELGAVLMRLGNNVRFNFVPSSQEAGIARAVVRVGSGLIDMPGRQPALKEFGLTTVLASGTSGFTPEQFSRLVEETMLDFNLDLNDSDAFTFRGEMGVENLGTFLGIVTEFLDGPKFSSFAHDRARMQAAMNRSASTIGFQEARRDLTNHLFEGDPRFTWGTPIDYISLGVVDVRRWMEPALTSGYVEITLVGDVSEADATNAVARTLGALRQRALKKADVSATPAKVTATPGFRRIEFVGEHNLGMAVAHWPVSGVLTTRDRAALTVLSKVVERRVREQVRDNLGLAYAPSMSFEAYDGFPNLAMLQAVADCAPTEAERVAREITGVGARVAEGGVKEGEFIGARGILLSQLKRAFLDNDFLISMLQRAQEDPATLEEAVELHRGLIAGITLDEVNTWAVNVMPADNCRSAALVPKTFIGIFEPVGM